MRNLSLDTIAVIDFETTGLSPAHGERATEIAAVLVREGRIVDRYQSLMNAGRRVPPFIEALTGISTAMFRQVPPAPSRSWLKSPISSARSHWSTTMPASTAGSGMPS
jgi:DNA polymerase III epsilon subunit-like protein